jgi:hypothetical protein
MTKKRLSKLLISLSLVLSGISFIDISIIKNTNIAYSDTIVESGKRKALIIGNKNYNYATTLNNTHSDADAVAKKLSELKFEVTKKYDLKNKKDMKSVIQDFYDFINPNDTVFVYYSGHGVQIDDKNYLVPTNADLKIETDAEDEALSVDYLIKSLKDKSNVLFVVLDACRDNPLKSKSLGSKKGLQPIRNSELIGSQLVVLYATSENETASDYHPVKKNLGLFAGELVDVLGMENKTSDSIFNQLTSNLKKLSKGKQIPYKHTQLEGDFYFNQVASASINNSNLIQNPIVQDNNQKKKTWKWVIEPQFNDISSFSDGLAGVKKGDKWGYIDKNGKLIIEPQFSEMGKFSDGLSKVIKDGKYFYIDKTGKYVIQPQFDISKEFLNGFARVKQNGKCGYIDKTGKYIIQPQFDDVFNFFEDVALVKQNGMYGYIDKTGKYVIQPQFDDASNFSDGVAKILKDGRYGYIDKTGRWVIEPKFDSAYDFTDNIAKAQKNGKYGYIDKTGKWIIEPQFDYSYDFTDGIAKIEKDGRYGYIDKTGKWVIEPQFNADVYIFSNGLAGVKKDGKWGYIGKNGKWIIEPQFDFIGSFSEELAPVKKDGKWGYIDKTGKWFIAPQFDYSFEFEDGFAQVQKNGKYGYIKIE